MEDQIRTRWRKASFSGNGGGDCVEVATPIPGSIAVRDSKNPDGPVLTVEPGAWASFTARLKLG